LSPDPDQAPASQGDLRLGAGSPAIDAGNDSVLPPGIDVDLGGLPRIIGGRVDLGAHEHAGPLGPSPGPGPVVTALPASLTPGSELAIRAAHLPSNALIRVQLRSLASNALVFFDDRPSDAAGSLSTSFPLPESDPGQHVLELQDASHQVLAWSGVTILPALQVRLEPAGGPPGTRVDFTVTGLTGGLLRLDYDGWPVFGPLPVEGGSLSGEFFVPSDRPLDLPGTVRVVATAFSGSLRSGLGETQFQAQAPSTAPRVRVLSLITPQTAIPVTSSFTVSGRIATNGLAPDQLQVSLWWFGANGQTTPMSFSPGSIGPDGSFAVAGVMPGKFSNHAPVGNLLGIADGGPAVVFTVPQGGPPAGQLPDNGTVHIEPFGLEWQFPDNPELEDDPLITIFVVDHNGQPVANALVVVDGDFLAKPRKPLLSNLSTAPLVTIPNQFNIDWLLGPAATAAAVRTAVGLPIGFANGLGIPDLVSLHQAQGCPMHFARGLTDANGRFQIRMRRSVLTEAYNLKGLQDTVAGSDASHIHIATIEPPVYRILINAIGQGLTFGTDPSLPRGAEFEIFWDWEILQFTSLWADHGYNPVLTFTARPYTGQTDFDFQIHMPRMQRTSGEAVAAWGDVVTWPDLAQSFTRTSFGFGSLYAHVLYYEGLFGPLDRLTLFRREANGSFTQLGDFERLPGAAACGTEAVEYRAPIQQYWLLDPPGSPDALGRKGQEFQVRARRSDGETLSKNFMLRTRLGPRWFEDASDLGDFIAIYAPPRADSNGSFLARLSSVPNRIEVSGQTFDLGDGPMQLDNDNEVRMELSQPELWMPIYQRFRRKVTATNIPSSQDDQASRMISSAAFTPGMNYVLHEEQNFYTLFDTGRIPLLFFQWGFWPVAGAAMGLDVQFQANLYTAILARVENGRFLNDTQAIPSATAALFGWIDASIAGGFLGHVYAEISPSFTLAMPLVVENNVLNTDLSGPCFRFAVNVKVLACVIAPCIFDFQYFSRTEALADIREPSGCLTGQPSSSPRSLPGREGAEGPVATTTPVALAIGPLGQGVALIADPELGLLESTYVDGSFSASLARPDVVAPVDVAVAYLAADDVVAVWSEAGLESLDELLQSRRSEAGEQLGDIRLFWSRRQAGSWSPKAELTPPSGGEAGLALAACPAATAGCPAGGELTLVWNRMAGASLGDHHWSVHAARFVDGVWTTPVEIGAEAGISNSHPQVVYVQGRPLVSWVRARIGAQELASRRLAYQFLDPDGGGKLFEAPANLPERVLWQSLALADDERPVIAFTVAESANAMISNRQTLHLARGECDPLSLSCDFSLESVTDSEGRALRVERPRLLAGDGGELRIVARGTGYAGEGPASVQARPGDPLGMILGSGELIQVVAGRRAGPADVVALSGDGQGHLAPVAGMDRATGRLVALSQRNALLIDEADIASDPLARTAARGREGRAVQALRGALLDAFVTPDLPDFRLQEALLPSYTVDASQSLEMTVRFNNLGQAFHGEPGLQLVATWDGPAGVGIPAGAVEVSDAVGSAWREVQVPIQLPPAYQIDQERFLFVSINPGGSILESDTSDNSLRLAFGGLPIPTNLDIAMVEENSGAMVLVWDQIDDPRVNGFRVYRETLGGDEPLFQPVGSSPIAGFLDLFAVPGERYRYHVTSYSVRGIESAPSAAMEFVNPRVSHDVLFQDRLERPESDSIPVTPNP